MGQSPSNGVLRFACAVRKLHSHCKVIYLTSKVKSEGRVQCGRYVAIADCNSVSNRGIKRFPRSVPQSIAIAIKSRENLVFHASIRGSPIRVSSLSPNQVSIRFVVNGLITSCERVPSTDRNFCVRKPPQPMPCTP